MRRLVRVFKYLGRGVTWIEEEETTGDRSKMKKTFWITKYALTKGLFQEECEVVVSSPEVTYAKAKSLFCLCRIGRDAFENKEEAFVNAIKRARAKRIALSKQSAKLTDLIAVWSDGAS